MVGSFAQLLVTLLAGTAGLMILKKNLLEHFNGFTLVAQFLQYGLLLLCLFLIFLYFNVTGGVRVFSKWIRNQKYVYLVTALNSFTTPLLLRLLLLSFVRYIIFMLQYLFVFYLFDVNVGVFIMLDVMSVVFLAMAVIPSIALVEVWLRGEIIILLMGLFSANTLGIGFTSVTIWCLNLILPAIAGSLLLLKLRVFNKRHETV